MYFSLVERYIIGLSNEVLKWFQSYLEQRSQRVSVHYMLSDFQLFVSNVPQGYFLDPLVFKINIHHL